MQHRLHLRGVQGGILDPHEGQLNGVQYIRALRPVLQAQGVAIYENTPVTKVEEGTTITLHTQNGRVRAKAILLATNGYTGKLGYFRHDYFPLHSHVLATAPLSADQRAKIGWHTTAGFADDRDRLAYGTCTPEGHIVFGGGNNSAYAYLFNNRTAYPGSPHSAGRAFGQMGQLLDDYLPGTAALPLTHRWTGTLAITLRRNCLIGVRGEARNVYYALGYNGHGVTAANMAGRLITDLYSGQDETWRGLPFVQHPAVPHIPLEPFRWFGYQMMTRITGRSPREVAE
jgi:gamma-glutamylputrescine oxidase